MKTKTSLAAALAGLITASSPAIAAPAIDVLGRDFTFPHDIAGLPRKLSDFRGLEIKTFATSDGVRLTYWEAGQGDPIIFVPGWSANGAEYINVMYLLSKTHRVIVLDPRNQGLSPNVDYGNSIARYSKDLKDLVDHLHIEKADFSGWSMGASVIWSYIDLFGTDTIRKVAFVDEPVSIAARPDWTVEERRERAVVADTPDDVVALLKTPPPASPDPQSTSFIERFMLRDSKPFANSEAFANAFVHSDMTSMIKVMYNHASIDWSEVIQHKLNTVPVAFFTGEWSLNVAAQRWAHKQVPGSKLFIYTKAEQGDHFLMLKNPFKFTADLESFLDEASPAN
ncbi:alpha/beta hydrolase [Novosphingobium profundi]|uniref:alpha/beta fold hydrolase n=1 Tax=Novosphingobium profundi TaxID=1774954 RepID=UPI001BDA4949|nr:alpha/beta hydrolase [Novosphingobium profundi]MBT0667324.1 alpha/beta hydrolase [Novosphingobium profundi]